MGKRYVSEDVSLVLHRRPHPPRTSQHVKVNCTKGMTHDDLVFSLGSWHFSLPKNLCLWSVFLVPAAFKCTSYILLCSFSDITALQLLL